MLFLGAMFSPLPIVASKVGGIPDVIKHEQTGLLCEPGNAEELANTLVRILRDKNLAKKLSATAFERFSDRNVQQSAKKLGDLFISLLRKKPARV